MVWSTEDAKQIVERELAQGSTIEDAVAAAGKGTEWFVRLKGRDRLWKDRIDLIIAEAGRSSRTHIPDFPEFCEQYLGMKLWPHQLAMFDVLEGREPRWKPYGVMYEPGTMEHRRIIINLPPGFAKTMTVSISYVLWRILRDPGMSVLLISRTQEFAKKILWGLKQRLTHPRYADLQRDFGPAGGFRETADVWTANKLYLFGSERETQEKDPTIEAVGIGGQIYGNRARLIVVDDAVLLSNAAQWEAQQTWLSQEAASRIGPDDQLVIVGTRVAPVDLYRELRNPDHYHDGQIPWTYLGLPAVLTYGQTLEEWRTLWPVADHPFTEADKPNDEGLYDRWTGPRLARVRNEVGARRWSLVYQQADIVDDGAFDPVCVMGSIDQMRTAGAPIQRGAPGMPELDADLFTVIGVDPAIRGVAGFAVLTADRRTLKRWLVDIKAVESPTPKQIRETIMALVERTMADPGLRKVHEVRVEANAYQLAIVQDEVLVRFLAERGVLLTPHQTYANRTDPYWGVAALSMLLGTTSQQGHKRVHNKDNLLSLPNQNAPGTKVLVEQMISFDPTRSTKQQKGKIDLLMALWIAETRMLQIQKAEAAGNFSGLPNPFLSRAAKNRRATIRLSDMAQAGATGRFL